MFATQDDVGLKTSLTQPNFDWLSWQRLLEQETLSLRSGPDQDRVNYPDFSACLSESFVCAIYLHKRLTLTPLVPESRTKNHIRLAESLLASSPKVRIRKQEHGVCGEPTAHGTNLYHMGIANPSYDTPVFWLPWG